MEVFSFSAEPPASVVVAWRRTCSRLEAAGFNWRAVTGPMSAAIVTLRELGWVAEGPLEPNEDSAAGVMYWGPGDIDGPSIRDLGSRHVELTINGQARSMRPHPVTMAGCHFVPAAMRCVTRFSLILANLALFLAFAGAAVLTHVPSSF